MADRTGPRILLVTSRYYADIARELEAGVTDELEAAHASWDVLEVPGAFELPGAIAMAAQSQAYDGFVALGCVIRGETSHYDHICTEVARGLMELSLAGVPVAFGVITAETDEQAEARADRKRKNKGREAALAVLRMAELRLMFASEDEIYAYADDDIDPTEQN
jgi:6,7-dimethyl-8-ribityllumazine synthase